MLRIEGNNGMDYELTIEGIGDSVIIHVDNKSATFCGLELIDKIIKELQFQKLRIETRN